MTRLRRVDCATTPGYTRRKRGKGWTYLDHTGAAISDLAELERITALVIPPAWADVWICPYPRGHIQAMGTDAAGRRQYRYHDLWRQQRDEVKFDRVLEFAERLPAARDRIERDLRLPDMPRERVLACAFRLLEIGFFRVGSEEYAEKNRTYGLATMRRDHVTVSRAGIITFDYIAKSKKHRVQSVADPEICEIVRTLKRRRSGGPELLAFRENGRWRDVRSADVNSYLRDVTGGDFSAKDFRTWNATVLAAVGLAVSSYAVTSPTARKRAVNRVVKEVAEYLGNTPAVCRSSYIDPRVFDRYEQGHTVLPAIEALGDDVTPGDLATHGTIEAAVLALLRDEPVGLPADAEDMTARRAG